jgi:hypothetical protein
MILRSFVRDISALEHRVLWTKKGRIAQGGSDVLMGGDTFELNLTESELKKPNSFISPLPAWRKRR